MSSDPIRVLAVMDKLGYHERLFGSGRLWLATLPIFLSMGCMVIPCVLRLNAELNQRFAQRGVRIRDLHKNRHDPLTIISLCRLIWKERIQVLHLHGDGATTFGRIAAWLTGVPAIVHYHDLGQSAPKYVGWFDRALAPLATKAVAISAAVAEACVSARHIRREKVVVITNAIEEDWSQDADSGAWARLRHTLGIPKGTRVIGAVTRFRWEKDLPTMIEALALLKDSVGDWQAVIAGDGPDRKLVEQAIAQANLGDRVHLVGFQADVRPYLSLMDVSVFSSVTEGFGLALLEAMAMERPIVATAVGGMKELIQDQENGLLVPPSNPAALADGIRRLLSNPEEAARMSRQAKQDAVQFGARRHVEQLCKLYEEVARR